MIYQYLPQCIFLTMLRIFIVKHLVLLGMHIKAQKNEEILQKQGNRLLIKLLGQQLRKSTQKKKING